MGSRLSFLGTMHVRCWQVLEPVIGAFAPDLILVSAGYDAVQGDPLGGMSLTPELYGHLTARLIRLAARGRLALALEGGYNLRQTAECAAECAKVRSVALAATCSSVRHGSWDPAFHSPAARASCYMPGQSLQIVGPGMP